LNFININEKLTNRNTVNIPKTAILETAEISFENIIITVIDIKADTIVANHGVFLLSWIFEKGLNNASSFAIPYIILDDDTNIISTVFVVAKSAIRDIIRLPPLFSDTFSITNAKGTFDVAKSCHVTKPNKPNDDITTNTYAIVVIIMDNNIAREIVFDGFLVSSAILGIFSNP
jgi:hypothetical protein